jgi:ubiquinone/menaquinone biosynthesis C-methylase UbiE
MDAARFPWPSLSDGGPRPVWTAGGFQVAGARTPVLAYGVGDSGWNDSLTTMHEDTAGSDHPIDLASRRHAVEQLRKNLPRPDAVVLEVGCSSGYLLRDMQGAMPEACIIGADYVRGPLETLAGTMPTVPILQFDLQRCPLPDASVDAVVLLNVLEHIENDGAAVGQLFRILRPGGVAVVEIPAGPQLFDVYDKLLMHFRRYRLKGAISLFEGAGFQIVKASHLGFFVYPAFWAVKKKNRMFAKEESAAQVVEKDIKKSASPVLASLMNLELKLGAKMSFPAGIRCLLTCRKPEPA